jgi:DNA-binding NtrC family response regulator
MLPGFNPHIVLLDVAMPGINGLKTLEKIRALAPHCCVIMMSGHASHQSALKAMDQGALEFLQKPFDFDYLERMLLTTVATQVARDDRGRGSAAS